MKVEVVIINNILVFVNAKQLKENSGGILSRNVPGEKVLENAVVNHADSFTRNSLEGVLLDRIKEYFSQCACRNRKIPAILTSPANEEAEL